MANQQNRSAPIRFTLPPEWTPHAAITHLLNAAGAFGISDAIAVNLIGTLLALRFPKATVPTVSSHNEPCLRFNSAIFLVATSPTHADVEKGKDLVDSGKLVYLLVPLAKELRVRRIAVEQEVEHLIAIHSIENFVANSLLLQRLCSACEAQRFFIDLLRLHNNRVASSNHTSDLLIDLSNLMPI